VEGAPLAAGQGVVEDVADDAAREGEPVSARFPLFFEQSLAQELLARFVEVLRVLGQRFEVPVVEAPAQDRRDERISRWLSGSRSMRFSTACWIVAGSASEEIAEPLEKFHAPESSRAIPPESMSDRTSSLVKKGFPSVASRSLSASESVTFEPPETDSINARCSDGENGPSVIETNRGSSAKESSIRIRGCRLSVSVCR
jgi:hypothetical protein